MHLRVTEEVEMNGLDLDQFFDESIGDWGLFDELNRRKLEMEISSPGTPRIEELAEPVKGANKEANDKKA
jgi:Amt family ammonium transporter